VIEVLAAMALAALLSALVVGVRLRFRDSGLDLPGHRSLHATPTPHGGGLGIVAAALVIGAWAGVEWRWLVAMLVLAGVSLADDWLHLPFWVRLIVHLGVSASVVFAHESGPGLTAAVAILLMAWATNAYNFMDGADGLAGSMALAGFGAYALAFGEDGMASMALMCSGIAAAAAAFLCFNWHPARIFMGDVGAIPLGFLAGGLGWHGVVTGAWPAWFPLLVFAPFLGDASVTLARRAWRRERVWEAHRDHYYQRMVRMGMAHDVMCMRWLALMLAGAALAVGLLAHAPALGWPGLLGWMIVLGTLGRLVDRRWNENERRMATK
jgi:UDP-N-acetylmuramyl pentapeptide phosphotransferase/UDP-N-acetylglucosamine-1-phosphate transferase